MTTYDYDKQTWVTGLEAIALRRRQLLDEIEILTSDGGAEYLAFIGWTGSVNDAIRTTQLELDTLDGRAS